MESITLNSVENQTLLRIKTNRVLYTAARNPYSKRLLIVITDTVYNLYLEAAWLLRIRSPSCTTVAELLQGVRWRGAVWTFATASSLTLLLVCHLFLLT